MNTNSNLVERVIGFDSHPDSFTAAMLRGPSPAGAVVEKIFNKLPMARLSDWAKKNTTAQDLFVLEASGNSFQVVRGLAAIQRKALVLESCQLGKLKEAHANNDKISAVRIGKAYLAGTAKTVWVPDTRTQERRDWFHAHRKATKRTTQIRARLRSYLSDNGVRLKRNTHLTKPAEAEEHIRKASQWSARQWQVIEGLLMELRHAEELVGDIHRFAEPKKLVKYIGLNPAFDDSGESQWSGGIGGHGRKDLRCLLVEGAQAILRCSNNPLAQWGKKLLARKGSLNLVVCAVARRLAVAVWYLMMGRWTTLEEIDKGLELKIGKMISQVGAAGLKNLNKTRNTFREQIFQSLKTQNAWVLGTTVYTRNADGSFSRGLKPQSASSLAQEYGLR